MLGAPGGTGTAHIVQLWPVGPDGIAGQFPPKTGNRGSKRRKGAWQQRNRGTRKCQDRSTHGATPTPTWQARSACMSLGRPIRRRGSWIVMMASQRLRRGALKVLKRHFCNQAFQRFTASDLRARSRACPFEFPPLHQPRISRQSVGQRVSADGRIRGGAGVLRRK